MANEKYGIRICSIAPAEINLLKELNSTPEEKRYSNIESCFAIRQDNLIKAIRGKETALAAIGIDGDKKLLKFPCSKSSLN